MREVAASPSTPSDLRRYTKSPPLLWGALLVLVLVLIAVLAFLARNYEDGRAQLKLEQTADIVAADIRSGLQTHIHDLQSLSALNAHDASMAWMDDFVARHHEIFYLEARDLQFRPLKRVVTPFLSVHSEPMSREEAIDNVKLACNNAVRYQGAGYAPSYFWPVAQGIGQELMEMCLPIQTQGQISVYVVATYRLSGLLSELIRPEFQRQLGLSLTESDGTRLAILGRNNNLSKAQKTVQLLDLPGAAYMLRVERPQIARGWFPDVLTAVVALLSLALLSVLYLLTRDVRRRQRAEHNLASSLAFRQAMEDSLVTGLRARDMDGRITYVNAAFCRMVGLPAERLLGSGMPAPYWPPELANEYAHRRELREAHPEDPTIGFETEFMHADGRRIPVRIFEAPLLDGQGQPTGSMSTILDVSEQRRMEDMTRTSQERLQATARLAMAGEVASLISHELNQPLAAIASYATGSLNLLEGEHASDAQTLSDIHEAMRRMADESARAGKVIKSVADLVRRRDHAYEVVSVQDLLDAIAPLMRLRARKEAIELRWDLQADCPSVRCDRTMVEQVLLNLARNGIQAMPAGDPAGHTGLRVLTVSVREVPEQWGRQWLEFSVQDHGHGLSAEVERQLFTPFFTTKEEGMGLGLSLCRTVVEQHGGRLWHHAAQPRGTVFSFTLPVAKSEGSR